MRTNYCKFSKKKNFPWVNLHKRLRVIKIKKNELINNEKYSSSNGQRFHGLWSHSINIKRYHHHRFNLQQNLTSSWTEYTLMACERVYNYNMTSPCSYHIRAIWSICDQKTCLHVIGTKKKPGITSVYYCIFLLFL